MEERNGGFRGFPVTLEELAAEDRARLEDRRRARDGALKRDTVRRQFRVGGKRRRKR